MSTIGMTTIGQIIEGRTWVFADANINTDLMMPPRGYVLPWAERAKLAFSANRPGWAEQVRHGDILVGGRNFGAGSSRPAAEVFRVLGITAVLADSINGLFFRNCINYGVPVMECPGITASLTEGDVIRVNIREGEMVNTRSGARLSGTKIPDVLIDILESGGLRQRLEKQGYI